MDNKQSRMAELALEMFGAKTAESFLREAWAAASPETKTELADALVASVRKSLTESWDSRHVVQSTIQQLLDERKEHVTAVLRPIVNAQLDRLLANGEQMVVKAVTESYHRLAEDRLAAECVQRAKDRAR
jgi:phage terminase large subunit GpA-like protein